MDTAPRLTTILSLLIFCVSCLALANASHVRGSWDSRDFFLFFEKFAFQRTDVHDADSAGYVYGNISSRGMGTNVKDVNRGIVFTFSILDKEHFLPYYGNRSLPDKGEACRKMFANVGKRKCNSACCEPDLDFYVRVPCKIGGKCRQNLKQADVVQESQFTYRVENLQPKFWYISLVACYYNEFSCSWQYDPFVNITLDYDIWLVNGNPNQSFYKLFTYQFSFDKHDTVEFYLLFFVIYAMLVPVQIYAATHQTHPVTKIFTASLIMEFCGILFNLLNSLIFAIKGQGFANLATLGDVFDIFSKVNFMLLLLLLAKGWAVTRVQLTWKPVIFGLWFLYAIIYTILYFWKMGEVDSVKEIDEYQTWPGLLIVLLRFAVAAWFLTELRHTMKYEYNGKKLNFFLHFGAAALVWFIYLPISAFIALNIDTLWRNKLLLGIEYAADCLAYCIMTHLLWPTRSDQYFLLANTFDARGDELEVFNEAPHILNSYKSPTPYRDAVYSKLIDL